MWDCGLQGIEAIVQQQQCVLAKGNDGRLNRELFRLMKENDAPPEAVRRMEESLVA